jgi:hypothetical protein
MHRIYLFGSELYLLIGEAPLSANKDKAEDGSTESIAHVTVSSVSSSTVSTWRVTLVSWFSDNVITAGSDVIRGG